MSININTVDESVIVMPSVIVETISAVNILADGRHHEFVREWADGVTAILSNKSRETLKLISQLPYQGLELNEIVLNCREFDNFEKLYTRIIEYDNVNFIYTLTGEQLSIKKIQDLRCDKSLLKPCLENAPWFVSEDLAVYEYVMYNTDNFKDDIISLLKEVEPHAALKFQELITQYDLSVKEIKKRLKKISPLELMQQLMNKKITENLNIKEFFFIPSFYIKPHYLLAFNKYSRLIVYDIRLDKSPVEKEASNDFAETLKVVSDKTRLELLRLIILQPSYGKLLANRLNLTTATISHHLDLLLSQGLIKESKTGNIKYFSANIEEIQKTIKKLKDYLFNN